MAAETEVKPKVPVAIPIVTLCKRPIKTALHQAVLDRRLHQVRLLVAKHSVNVDSRDVFGRTPLMYACLLDDDTYSYKMVKIFLDAGAFINVKDNMGRTAFVYACMKGRYRVAQRLMKEVMLEINSADNDGNTPLCHAALSGNPTVVELLVDTLIRYGLPIDYRNGLGYTALLLACKYGHYVSAHYLLTAGRASPSIRDNEFFLNAKEWTERSHIFLSASLGFFRSKTDPEMTSKFSREHSMYGPTSPRCHHWNPPRHPLGRSLGSALRLPSIFQNQSSDTETFIGGREARRILMDEIDEVLTEQEGKLTTHNPFQRRKSHPKTAILRAIARKSQSGQIPDMKYIFRMYSDQYYEYKPASAALKSQEEEASTVEMPDTRTVRINDGANVVLIDAN